MTLLVRPRVKRCFFSQSSLSPCSQVQRQRRGVCHKIVQFPVPQRQLDKKTEDAFLQGQSRSDVNFHKYQLESAQFLNKTMQSCE